MIYLRDDDDRAPRINGTDLSDLAWTPEPDETQPEPWTWKERLTFGLAFFYLLAGGFALLGCGAAGVVWAWLHLPH